MHFINPTINGFTPEYNFVTEKTKYYHWQDFQIELPTGGWCFMPFETENQNDKDGVLIGFKNQYWTETFFVTPYNSKNINFADKTAALYRENSVEPEKKQRPDKLFVPENEKLFEKGSFTVKDKFFDFMLTGGIVNDTIRRRFFCFYYPDGNRLGPSFFAEHLVEMHESIKIDIIGNDSFNMKAISIISTLSKIE